MKVTGVGERVNILIQEDAPEVCIVFDNFLAVFNVILSDQESTQFQTFIANSGHISSGVPINDDQTLQSEQALQWESARNEEILACTRNETWGTCNYFRWKKIREYGVYIQCQESWGR